MKTAAGFEAAATVNDKYIRRINISEKPITYWKIGKLTILHNLNPHPHTFWYTHGLGANVWMFEPTYFQYIRKIIE